MLIYRRFKENDRVAGMKKVLLTVIITMALCFAANADTLVYKKFDQDMAGAVTGHFEGWDASTLFDKLTALFPAYKGNTDWALSGNKRRIKIRRLGEKAWTKAEKTAIRGLVSAHGTKKKHEYRKAVKETYRLRRKAMPSVADQLDAIWKSWTPPVGSPAEVMKARILKIKAGYPKPTIE